MAPLLLARNLRLALAATLLGGLIIACQRRPAQTSSILVPQAGTWSAIGYLCDGPAPTQIVRISQSGTLVKAVKLKGDACVGDDQPTWEGYYTRNAFSAKLFGALDHTPAVVRVLSANKLELREEGSQIITFVRQTSSATKTVTKP